MKLEKDFITPLKRANGTLSPDSACTCCQERKLECTKQTCFEIKGCIGDVRTQLHLTCQNPNCAVDDVRDLVAAFPSALQRRDEYGRSPLFYAIKQACSAEVVIFLFDCFPEAILLQDFCGDTPLYLLYHCSTDYLILKHVLQKMPSLAMHKEKTFSGQTLVKRICVPMSSKQIVLTRSLVAANATLNDWWEKLVLTVRAAHAFVSGLQLDTVSRHIPDLHVALEFSCPPLVLCHFVEMYPEQVSIIMAKEGCYPLHYFLSRCDVTPDSLSAVQSFIAAFPLANDMRFGRQLPIHLAISSGRTWNNGVKDIVFAGPSSLDVPDTESGLIPFLQASALATSDMTTVYSLLRENPAVIANLSQ